MAANFPGPYELRIRYSTIVTSITNIHQLRISMDMNVTADPGDPFSDWTCQSRIGASPQLDTFTDDVAAVMQPFLRTDADILDAELWEYTPGSFDAAFRSTYTIGVAGTAGGATVPDSQGILTFRTQLGGVARFDIRDITISAGAKVSVGAAPTIVQDVADLLTANGSPMIGRDNSYVFVALNWLPGLNERSFKKRLRQ